MKNGDVPPFVFMFTIKVNSQLSQSPLDPIFFGAVRGNSQISWGGGMEM